jgi:hypothetical protein
MVLLEVVLYTRPVLRSFASTSCRLGFLVDSLRNPRGVTPEIKLAHLPTRPLCRHLLVLGYGKDA